jgi:DNA-binding beta-propeller fold protein YncE
MIIDTLVVALGNLRCRVERPWGALPVGSGKVTDVAALRDGRVLVLTRRDHYVEPKRDCVQVLDGDGAFLGSWGGGRIADAHMIAVDALDRVWVVDRDCHEVVCFDADGRELASLGARHRPLEPFNHPSDVAFGPDGRIWVSDGYAGGRIHCFSPSGDLLHSFGEVGVSPGSFITPHGLWVTGDGRVMVADRENNRIQLFDETGVLLDIWPGFHRPSDIWGDADGHLYIVDGVPTLTRLDASGRRVGRCRPVLNGAHGMWGTGGLLFLAEGNPSRITRLAPTSLV